MKRFFENTTQKLRLFMYGRYGTDELSRFLTVAVFVTLVLSWIKPFRFMYFISLALMIWAIYRCLSKNFSARQRERSIYLIMSNKLKKSFNMRKNMWRDRKTHRYYKCPCCKRTVRIKRPPKHTRISVKCTVCGNTFIKNT